MSSIAMVSSKVCGFASAASNSWSRTGSETLNASMRISRVMEICQVAHKHVELRKRSDDKSGLLFRAVE